MEKEILDALYDCELAGQELLKTCVKEGNKSRFDCLVKAHNYKTFCWHEVKDTRRAAAGLNQLGTKVPNSLDR